MINVKHQYDEKGNHRIVVDGKIGNWTWYQGFAELIVDDKFYRAATEYYGEAVQVSTIPTKVDFEIENVCRDCDAVFTWNTVTGDIITGCEHVRNRSDEQRAMLDRMSKK